MTMLSRICGASCTQDLATSMSSRPVRVARIVSADDARCRAESPKCSAFAAQQERRKLDRDGGADVPSIPLAGSIPGASTLLTLCQPVTGQDQQRHNPCHRRGLLFHRPLYILPNPCQPMTAKDRLGSAKCCQCAANSVAGPEGSQAPLPGHQGRCGCNAWSCECLCAGQVPSLQVGSLRFEGGR